MQITCYLLIHLITFTIHYIGKNSLYASVASVVRSTTIDYISTGMLLSLFACQFSVFKSENIFSHFFAIMNYKYDCKTI